MTWTKLGDEFSDAAAPLSDAAFRTHVEALGWSNRRLLDLEIPKRSLKRFAESDNPHGAAKELVQAGWWEDRGESWWIGCLFPEWQVERSVIEKRRADTAERVRRHRMHKAEDHSLCETSRCNALRDALPGTGRDGPGRASTTGGDSDVPWVTGTVPPCGHCRNDVAGVTDGEVMLRDGLPYCGWCLPEEGAGDAA